MNAPPIPVAPAGAGQLHARRCVRHPAREAAARCPGCHEFYCRECVVEHDGRLLCAGCIARLTAAKSRRRERLAAVRRLGSAAFGSVALWLVFYWIGSLLVKIPPEFHDGTVWRKMADRPQP